MEEKMAAASSILFLFLLFSWADIACSLTQADALLQLKKSVQNAGALSSWVAGGDPCSPGWRGVICFHGIVTGLRLSRLSLAGTIDVDALQQLTGLRYVSFDGNDFSGLLPAFSGAGKLKAIFLHGNRFSGAIPDDAFAGMDSLKKLWLSGNNFSGPIPSSLTTLRHLIEIRLENNAFSGKLPSFLQPSIASFNVSNNRLEGDVPPEMAAKFDSSCFSGNPGLCFNGNACQAPLQNGGSSTPPPLPPPPPMAPASRSHKTMVLIVLVLAIMTLCGLSCSSRKKQQERKVSKLEPVYGSRNSIVEQRKHMAPVLAPPHTHDEEKAEESKASPAPARSPSPSMSPQADQVTPLPPQPQPASSSAPSTGAPELVFVRDDEGKQRSFALMDLMKAAAEVLGSGALGSSYKAVLTSGMSVVVKRMKDMNQEGKEGFREKIFRLGEIKHPNILPPTAYHYRTEEKLLVYEYATRGNLLLLIHGKENKEKNKYLGRALSLQRINNATHSYMKASN